MPQKSLAQGLAKWAGVAVLATVCCGTARAADRVTVQSDENLSRLPGNTSSHARPELDQGRVPDSLPQEHILMMLRRSQPQQQALEQFMARQYDPRSPDFHRWLTPQQFGAEFGPSSEDVRKVTQWLTQHGFRLNSVPAGGLFVDFSGTAGQVAQAFHTEIHRYRVNGQNHYANASDPYIPATLAPVVSGFRALNDFHPQAMVHHLAVAHLDRSTGKWSRSGTGSGHLTSAANALYITGPQDYARIYGVDKVWQERVDARSSAPPIVGTGQTIAVVGQTNLESADIESFRDTFGITALGPNGSVQMENPPASVCAAPDPSDNEPEGYLDAEWSGAMAPDATIDFVACGRQGVTSGADLAAAYIIQDPAHVQRISVLSTSYGDCEAQPQSEANQFYVSLWQQAAAEGITVVVASGDTGGDGCQNVGAYATDGLSPVNEASTPYNVAAGGTDFSDVFSGTAGTYWSAENGPNFVSAQSYIPEMPWNESCASPLVLQYFGQGFAGSSGPNGFCTWAAQQPADPNTGFSPYANAWAGSGGLSTVSGRPAWQTGVPGIPQQGGRAVPDISMFASGGDTWSQTLILCDSALAGMPAGTACDYTNANDVFANYGGGTSFVAPAFAGIMALINQKSGDRQGQANYVLYPLAGEQYVSYGSSTQPSLANCAAYLGSQVLSGCYFHDISATPNTGASPATPFITGTTSVPCTGSATSAGTFTDSSTNPASNNENCYGYQITVTANGASLTNTPDYYGVLSTADNATSPAFAAGPGYDLATGLGSPNVYSLVNAPQWSGGGLATDVTLTLSQATVAAGQSVTLLATVADQGRLPVLGGTVTFYSGNRVLGSVTNQCSLRGIFGLQVSGATLGGNGSYQHIFASYAGGTQKCRQQTATYYGSQSAPATVVVSQGRPSLMWPPLRADVPKALNWP
jgi:subtilase family serine protease